jgi:hypothetical protein
MQHTQELWFHTGSITNTKDGYSRQTSFLAASIDLSVSQSAKMDKSLKFSGLSLSTLKTVRLSILNKDDVESHPARKLVCRLYDQKGKLKEDHVDLNKLRVRLATLRDACFKQTYKIIKKKSKPASGL